MSEEHDKRKTIKLDPENEKAVGVLIGKFTIKPSRAKLVNLAIELGLRKIKPQ